MMKLFSKKTDAEKEAKANTPRPPIIPQYEPFDWKRFFKRKRYIPWWILLVIIIVCTVLITVYNEQIVKWLTPISEKIRDLSWGWIIPIIILFILSYPPLFGHEIVAILCGVVYGLWIGFAIVAAGTFLGEIGTYYAFKGFLRHRAEKEEARNLHYACLATITREGGFWFFFIARLSAIPSHLTTAVFATCGVAFWIFLLATFLTLPKQLVVVYLGVIISNPEGGHTVSNVVLAITFVITILAAGYIYWQMRKVRPRLIAEAEARRNGNTSYEGAGDIEMAGGSNRKSSSDNDEDENPLMAKNNHSQNSIDGIPNGAPATNSPANNDRYRGQIFGTTETDGLYEPFRRTEGQNMHMPEPYRAYPADGFSTRLDANNNPYYAEGGLDSRNASAIDLGTARPVTGRELV